MQRDWLRILLGALLVELALMIVAVPVFFLPNQQAILSIIVPPVSFLVALPIGAWAAKPSARPVLTGAGVGMVSVVVYGLLILIALQFAPPERADTSSALSPSYLAAHLLKVLGGAVGGWWIAKKQVP